MAVAEEDQDKTAFVCSEGLYAWTVVPFGLRNAPSAFSRLVAFVTAGLEGCTAYLDDIYCWASTPEQMEQRLAALLQRLSEHKLPLNQNKLQLGYESLAVLGHIVSADGIAPDPEKLDSIRNYPRPTTTKELQRWLGLAGFYRQYMPRFSARSRPLAQAVAQLAPANASGRRRAAQLCWTAEMEAAFADITNALCEQPVLAAPDSNEPFTIRTDCSGWASGAVLEQNGRPVAFDSKRLDPAQQRYDARSKELLAVVRALKRWRHLLGLQPTTVVVDHASLVTFMSTTNLDDHTGRLARWAEFLATFDLRIVYTAGAGHLVPDALSRAPPRDSGRAHEQAATPAAAAAEPPTAPAVAAVTTRARRGAAGAGGGLGRHEQATAAPQREPPPTAAASPSASPAAPPSAPRTPRATTPPGQSSDADAATPAQPQAGPPPAPAPPPLLPEGVLQALRRDLATDDLLQPVAQALQHELDTGSLPGNLRGRARILAPACALQDGLLYRRRGTQPGWLLVLPAGKARARVLRRVHEVDAGHLDARRSAAVAARTYYCAHLPSVMHELVRKCRECAVAKHRRAQVGLMQPPAMPTTIFQHLSFDFCDMVVDEDTGFDYALVCVDRFSRFLFVVPCRKTASAADLAALFYHRIYPTTGVPAVVTADNGPQFRSALWQQLFRHAAPTPAFTFSTPSNPASNGLAERGVGCTRLLLRLAAAAKDGRATRWVSQLPMAVYAYNATPHASTGRTPYEVVFSASPRTLMGAAASPEDQRLSDDVVQQLREAHGLALRDAAATQAESYDKGRQPAPDLAPGDMVLVKTARLGKPGARLNDLGVSHSKAKAAPVWTGPFEVMSKGHANTYRIRLPSTFRCSPIINVKDLKPAAAEGLEPVLPPPVYVGEDGEVLWQVKSIKAHKAVGRRTYLLVEWLGQGHDDTWEPISSLRHLHILLGEYFRGKVPRR